MVFASSAARSLVTVFWQPGLCPLSPMSLVGPPTCLFLSPNLSLVQLSDVHVLPFNAGCVTK